jgi:GNAT superfamily N-acetyltransferase
MWGAVWRAPANSTTTGAENAPLVVENGGVEVEVEIRDCTGGDLVGLEDRMPLGVDSHRARLSRQEVGACAYLVASVDGPVGVCIVRWEGPYDAGIAAQLPECVEVNHLHVVASARDRGVGRALLGAAIARCRARGVGLVGVGVSGDNRAVRLYERLGFVDSGLRYDSAYEFVDDDGVTRLALEHNVFLVKAL